jgi:uncharacterized protein (DUF342 family)
VIQPTSAQIVIAALLLGATSGALAAPASNSPTTASKLYKWVDDKGETHYGEVIPPEYANRDHVQINNQGMQVKQKNAAGKSTGGNVSIEQMRKDAALLSSYSSEQEIDLARDRNLQQIQARIDSIQLLQQSTQDNMNSYNREADILKQAGKPIPPSLQADLDRTQDKLFQQEQQLAAAEEKKVEVKANFEADKVRYRELKASKQ